MSHPTWVRGLKHYNQRTFHQDRTVAPYVGAWIETTMKENHLGDLYVAPYVGAWIETSLCVRLRCLLIVAPYVGAWIETSPICSPLLAPVVAPYVGAWIETRLWNYGITEQKRRTLRGCVD